ncbi:MAG: fibronectin type III domain-containing protein [Granulosicoccaceae bacterium]
MSLNKVITSCVIIFCALTMSATHAATFAENNGVVMLEVESSAAQGDWKLQRSLSGYSGKGYYIWTGTDAFSKGSAGRGTITYSFRIAKAGNYQMRWRSRIGKGASRTEHNDSWVRFPTGKNINGQHALSGWTKVFMNTRDKWVWQSATVDGAGKPLRQYFSAGVHTVQISGRSSGHAIDKIAIYRYDSVPFSSSKFDSLPNSGTRSGTSAPITDPEPDVVAKPVVAAEPVVVAKPVVVAEPVAVVEPVVVADPVVVPVVSADPVSITAPSVSVSNNTLSWPAVNAIVINVHRGSGEWIESLSASTTQWQAPSAGTYYLVATGEGTWETWGRSATVTVEGSSEPVAPTVTAQVYSTSALEVFWNDGGIQGLSFEVNRDDQLQIITDGRSYFDDSLNAGTRYNYRVTAINAAGDVVWQQGVSVNTLGGAANTGVNNVSSDISLNLTAKAYSQSAIELFWNVDQLDASSTYQFSVYQNGELVKLTDGRSHFIEGLTAGTEYQMSVIATDAASVEAVSNAVNVTTYPVDRP